MSFHHIALVTKDLDATHRFYTEAMGFTLAKVVVAPTPSGQGWARHVFYDTGGQGLLAFWDLHDATIGDHGTAMSLDLGLPEWVNHVAFDSRVDDLAAHRDRWLDHGHDVVEVDHGFCVSIYANDPNGNTVEWCADTRPLDADDRRQAEAQVLHPNPTLEEPPLPVFHLAADHVRV